MNKSQRFFNYLKGNLKKNITIKLLFVVLAVAFCICLDTWNQLPFLWKGERGSLTVYYYIFNSFTYGGQYVPYIIPVLSTLIGTTEYCMEHVCEMEGFIVARLESRSAYAIVKIIISLVGAVFVVVGGMSLFIAIAYTFQPLYSTEFDMEASGFPYFSFLIRNQGIGYFLIILYLAALSTILWNMIALLCSAYFHNKYITITSPILFSYFLNRVLTMLQIPAEYRLDYWLYARYNCGDDVSTLLYTTIAVVGISCFCGILFVKKVKHSGEERKNG